MARRTTPSAMLLLLTAVIAGAGGCVHRTLHIDSDPPGALVYLNDQEVGRTPVSIPFTWYGTYDVRLEKEGFQTLHTEQAIDQPWWEHPGPDLFAEAVPDNRVERYWTFELAEAVPADEVDVDELLDHAGQLRELNQRDPE